MTDTAVITTATTGDINHVSVKPPPFWSNNPTFWFIQLEAQFSLARVTADETKYAYVVNSLTETLFNEVQDMFRLRRRPTSTHLSSRRSSNDCHNRRPNVFNNCYTAKSSATALHLNCCANFVHWPACQSPKTSSRIYGYLVCRTTLRRYSPSQPATWTHSPASRISFTSSTRLPLMSTHCRQMTSKSKS